MNNYLSKKVRKESRRIAKTVAMTKFDLYMRKAYKEVLFYRIVCVICVVICIAVVVYGK